mmetsp:Transcript_152813/g.490174  ORF Transcript_152813/g.490174 Transcript_152813/m.490174 type:complete len:340 (+) Transcript_152813:113-1132(+)
MTVERHLEASTLYKEDIVHLGHSAVWGSLWESSAVDAQDSGSPAAKSLALAGAQASEEQVDRCIPGRWGYLCCRSFDRNTLCSANPQASVGGNDGHQQASSLKSEVADPPQWESFDGSQNAFARLWVVWQLQAWRRLLAARDPTLLGDALFGRPAEADKAEEGLRPLLALLERVETRANPWRKRGRAAPKVLTERDDWSCPNCGYQNIGMRLQCRKCKRDDEDFMEPDEFPEFEQLVSEKVGQMVVQAAAQEHMAATSTFLELTIGHGRWRTDISGVTGGVGAPSRKSRAAQGHMMRQNAALAPMDSEEGKAYLMSLKRLLALAQLLHPHPDAVKNLPQ